MRPFSKEDYELVKDYEADFTRAIKSRYCTGLLRDELEVIHRIYGETLNRQANLSCGGCVLQMMTSVGRLYFHYKEELEMIAKANQKTIEEIKEQNKKRRKKNENETESKTS